MVRSTDKRYTSQTGLDKTIAFANEFFLVIEVRDHRVVIVPNPEQFHRADVDERENPGKGNHHNDLWSPMRCTVTYIGTVAIGLTIIEMSEEAEARYVNGEYVWLSDHVPKRRGRYAQDHGWTSTHDFPTGRLCLQAYSPYPRADWTQQWRREEKARRAAKALEDSKEELLQVIDAWAAAKRLEEFFADAERRARDLPEEQRERTIERLRQARALVGSTCVRGPQPQTQPAARNDPEISCRPWDSIGSSRWRNCVDSRGRTVLLVRFEVHEAINSYQPVRGYLSWAYCGKSSVSR